MFCHNHRKTVNTNIEVLGFFKAKYLFPLTTPTLLYALFYAFWRITLHKCRNNLWTLVLIPSFLLYFCFSRIFLYLLFTFLCYQSKGINTHSLYSSYAPLNKCVEGSLMACSRVTSKLLAIILKFSQRALLASTITTIIYFHNLQVVDVPQTF